MIHWRSRNDDIDNHAKNFWLWIISMNKIFCQKRWWEIIIKLQSMGNVSWVTGIELCFAYCTAFRKAILQTTLDIIFLNQKCSSLTSCSNQCNKLIIDIEIYLVLLQPWSYQFLLNYWCSFYILLMHSQIIHQQ